MSSATVSLVECVREVAREQVAPAAAGVDRDRLFPESSIRALAERGALGLLVPEACGGQAAGSPRSSRRARPLALRAPRRAWSS